MPERLLGRIQPPDDKHLRRYRLTADTAPTVPTSGVAGIWWYEAFEEPVLRNGFYWIGHQADWGPVLGGHAIACLSPHQKDATDWWRSFYIQPDGSCTGFSTCRVLSLANRRRYAAHELYEQAQLIDELADTPPEEGSTVRAACEVARVRGPRVVRAGHVGEPSLADGISAYRWPLTMEEVAASLSPLDRGKVILDRGYLQFLQSWGPSYPHLVRMPLEAAYRLLFREDGEYAIPTDR